MWTEGKVEIYSTTELENALGRMVNQLGIDNCIIIDAMYPPNKPKSDYAGLDYVLEKLKRVWFGKSVVIFTVASCSELSRNAHERYHALLGYPNVYFVDAIGPIERFKDCVEKATSRIRPRDELAIKLLGLKDDITIYQTLNHDYHYAETSLPAFQQWLERARTHGLKGTNDEIVEQVRSSADKDKAVFFKDQSFSGYFVDIEGTLLIDGKINQKLIEYLTRQSELKPITVWTGGDVREYQKSLSREIPWKITSKWHFRDAEVEIVIDDESEWKLTGQYGFKPVRYVKFPEDLTF